MGRGHDVNIYATGNDNEVKGFQDLPAQRIIPGEDDFSRLAEGYDVIVTGLSGFTGPDGHFVRAALAHGLPVVGVADQNSNYVERLGTEPQYLPTVIAVMSEECKRTLEEQLPPETGKEAATRARIVGWPAFDRYAEMRERFTKEDRARLLNGLSITSDDSFHVYFSQNTHPDCGYMSRVPRSREEKQKGFDYEIRVTQATFEAASDLGIKLAVKPHPGEEFERNYTKELCDRHGFTFIPARACNTQQVMLAAYSVTAGRSTCLTESTLLDRNTGGIIPDMGEEWISPFPPLALGAIPYTQEWERIRDVLATVTSKDEEVVRKLAEKRKKFSVDGNASKRLADLVEELGR